MRSAAANSIEQRLGMVEDYIAIMQLLAAYGPAADAGRWDLLEKIWASDSIYDIEGLGIFVGHDGLREVYSGQFHLDVLKAGSGHVASTPHIVIEGDRASATHHSTLYRQTDGAFPVIRLTAARWELECREGSWIATRRTVRLLKENPDARALLGDVFEGPGGKF